MDARDQRGDFLAWLGAGLVVGFFCLMMAGYYVPAYNGTDENGYLCSARRIALTGDSAKYTAHPLEHVSGNVVQVGDSTFYAKYPLGYPWLCAAAIKLGGDDAAFLVNPILAALAVLGMFLLARAMINPFAGVLAALLLATNPLHAQFGLSALSHSGAICFAVWSMFYLWRWVQNGGRVNAFVAGGLASYTYAVRYTEALLFLPLVAMVIWRYCTLPEGASPTERQSFVRRWRREVLLMAAGAFLLVLPLLIHQWIAFGRPWRTGYDLCGESTGFGWKWFQDNWWLMLNRMNSPGLLLIFPLGVIGLAYLLTHDPKRGVLLGLWAIPAVLLYTAYYWAPQGDGVGYARFFVSVFPPFIVSALALLVAVSRPRPVWTVALGVFIAIVASFNLHDAFPELENQQGRLLQVEETNAIVRRQVPEGSIVVAGYGSLDDIEFLGNYEMYAAETFDRKAIQNRLKILEDHDPHPIQRDKVKSLARLVGDMSDAQLAKMQQSLLATNLAAGRPVSLLCTSDQFRAIRGRLGETFDYDRTAEWVRATWPKNAAAPQQVTWDLYRLQPRRKQRPATETLAGVDEKIDLLQFRIRTLNDDFDLHYAGARKMWDEINESEKQLKELRDAAKKLSEKKLKKPPLAAAGVVATNLSASLTKAAGVTNLTSNTAPPRAGSQ
jgi:4-amino-4-deoxy-L-arabinose transferase-like glycosyltransferase